ncbi:hypothetical protein [Acidianus sp.]
MIKVSVMQAFMEELNYSHPYMPGMKNKLLPLLSVALIKKYKITK